MKFFTLSKACIPAMRCSGTLIALLLVGIQLFMTLPASSQNTGSIRGKVTNSQGITMPGVTVKLEGNVPQTQSTDGNGNYSFTNLRAGNYTVTFSFLGFTTVTNEVPLTAGQGKVLDIILSEGTSNLDEVVVVGYGTQKRSSVTASIATIQTATISKLPVASITNALGGRVPGLITRQGSGEPGDDAADLYIRGISTLGGTGPLLIVDGVPRSFSQLDPETIETISVLKDAAASAPYGIAGANGVILVTTKQGKVGLPTLTFTSSYGIQNPSILPEFPTSVEFAQMKNAASINEGLIPPYSAADLQKFADGSDPDRFGNTNPNDVIDRNVPIINNSVQMSGGSERIKYFASVGYLFQQGIFEPVKSSKYTLSLNLDGDVTKTTKISLKLNGRQSDDDKGGVSSNSLLMWMNYALPIVPLRWSNGEAATYMYPQLYESGYNHDRNTSIFTQLAVEQQLAFIPGLSAKAQIAYDPRYEFNKDWSTPTHVWAANFSTTPYTFTDAIYGPTQSSLTEEFRYPRSLTFQGSLNYQGTFGRHNFSSLALFEARGTQETRLGAGRTQYNLNIDELSQGTSNTSVFTNSGSTSMSRQMGVVYRLTYDYSGKYLAEFTGRYDGHYYFAPGKRFGFFPAVSLGWRLSEENFIKNNAPWISNLKIRGSYGQLGALAGSAFQYLATYNVNANAASVNGIAVQSVTERAEPNVDITWERAKKTDVALEASFWNGLLNFEVEYFHEMRSNMLFAPTTTLPSEYGASLSQINAGKMKNQGYEISLGSRYRFTDNLQASMNVNVTHAHNTRLEIFESATTFNNPNRRQTGRSRDAQFGYHALGFYLPEDFEANGNLKATVQTSPVSAATKVYPGDLKYKDINGDLKINSDDLVHIGDSGVPMFMYGINPGVTFKGLRLDVLLQGAMKRNIYMSDWTVWPFNVGRGAYKHNLDSWRPDNLDAREPRITNAPAANNTVTSSWWMSDGSYMRVKQVQLGLSIPKNLISRIGLASANLNLTGQNLALFSRMKFDYDPENDTNLGAYPPQQVISMGLNVVFK